MSKKYPKKILFKNTWKIWNLKKKTKTFLNKGTKHKKNYMEGLNS